MTPPELIRLGVVSETETETYYSAIEDLSRSLWQTGSASFHFGIDGSQSIKQCE